MKHKLKIGNAANIANVEKKLEENKLGLDNPKLSFVSDSQDVEAVKEYIGTNHKRALERFCAFFIGGTETGDYTHIYGCETIFPSVNETVYKITSRLV